MTVFDDDQDMRSQDDELLLTGHGVPGDGALLDVLDSLRTMAQEPAPVPNARLAAMLEAGLPARAAVVPLPVLLGRVVRRRARATGRWVAGLGVVGKVVLGAGVAMAGVAGAATIPAVPDVVQQPAQTVLSDLGHAFGGGVVSPSPSPSRSTGPGRDVDTERFGGAAGKTATAPNGSDSDLGPTGAARSSAADEQARTVPGRSRGTGDGSTAAPGQRSATEQGSPTEQSSPEQGTSDSQGSSEPAAATGPDGWMTRKQDATATRSPQPSSSPSPRADAGAATPASDR